MRRRIEEIPAGIEADRDREGSRPARARARKSERPARWARIIAALATASCGSLNIEPVDAPDWAQSLILLVDEEGKVRGQAADIEDDAPWAIRVDDRLERQETLTLAVLFYRRPLREMLIASGPLRRDPIERRNRLAPTFDEGATIELRGGHAPRPWRRITDLMGAFRTFESSQGDDLEEGCLQAGGCFVGTASLARSICEWNCSEPESPRAPTPSALLRMVPCPNGWREVERGEIHGRRDVLCEPWPRGLPDACDLEAFHLPGRPGCEGVGSACPSSGLPEAVASGEGVFFVRSGAPAGGDGSRTAPFSTIGEALAVVPAGGVVALGRGQYPESLELEFDLRLVGACPSETVILGARPEWEAVALRNGEVSIENLTVAGPVSASGSTSRLVLEGAVLRGSASYGLLVAEGAHARLHRVSIRDAGAAGLNMQGGEALAEQVSIAHAAHFGVVVEGSRLVLSDSVAWGVGTGSGERVGLLAHSSSITVERSALDPSGSAALDGVGPNNFVTVKDTVIGGSADEPISRRGEGIRLLGSTSSIVRTTVRGVAHVGIRISNGGSARLRDVAVLDASAADDTDGFGFLVGGSQVTATIERARVENALRSALLVQEQGTAQVTDLRVLRSDAADFGRCQALEVWPDGELTVSRTEVEVERGHGLYARGTVRLSDVAIRGTGIDDSRHGLWVTEGQSSLERVIIDWDGPAAMAVHGTGLGMRTLRAIDVVASRADFGVSVRGAASAIVSRFHLTSMDEAGIEVVDDRSRGAFSSGRIAGVPVGVRLLSRTTQQASLDHVLVRDVDRAIEYRTGD